MKRIAALLLVIAVLLSPIPALSDALPLQEFELFTKDDLPMLSIAAWDYLAVHGSGSITYLFSKELVNAYGVDTLADMCAKAGRTASMDGFLISYSTRSDGTLRAELSDMRIRSGEKMLNAYYYGDRSSLTSEESRCLDSIIQVMDGLMKKNPATSLELEAAIYDYICDRVRYQNYDRPDSRHDAATSACNAFLNGWGNCQAYSDLFRLMASIGGFSTGLISGYTNEAHMWNWIGTWFEGEYRVFMVDVTYGDHDTEWKTDHFYLNFGMDRTDDHTWYRDLFDYDEFERATDDSCTYYNDGSGFVSGRIDDAVQYLSYLAKTGRKSAEFLVFQPGIWETEITRALKSGPSNIRSWYYNCFRHDVGVVVSFWK